MEEVSEPFLRELRQMLADICCSSPLTPAAALDGHLQQLLEDICSSSRKRSAADVGKELRAFRRLALFYSFDDPFLDGRLPSFNASKIKPDNSSASSGLSAMHCLAASRPCPNFVSL